MITRRIILTAVGAASLLRPLRLLAQQRSKTYRIGFLGPTSAAAYASRIAAFRRGLGELGYVEGKNLVIEERWADGKYERLPGLVDELVKLKVDIIVATTTPAARAAQQSTKTVPIVAVNVANPLASGLVTSLARPGGNLTGLANYVGDTTEKQFGLLMALVPKLSRVAALTNPANQSHPGLLKSVEAAAEKTGTRVLAVKASNPAEIEDAYASIAQQRAEALIVLAEPLFYEHRVQVVALAARLRLPAIYNARQYVEAGGLISYGSNIDENHRHAARYVDKILKGARPGDLPVEQPSTIELTVNRKTAAQLGVSLPAEMLVSADKVVD